MSFISSPSLGTESGYFHSRFQFTDLHDDNNPIESSGAKAKSEDSKNPNVQTSGVRCHSRLTAFFLSCLGKITEYKHKDGTITYFNTGSLRKWVDGKEALLKKKFELTQLNELFCAYLTHQADRVLTLHTEPIARSSYVPYERGIELLKLAEKYVAEPSAAEQLKARIRVLEKIGTKYSGMLKHQQETSEDFKKFKYPPFQALIQALNPEALVPKTRRIESEIESKSKECSTRLTNLRNLRPNDPSVSQAFSDQIEKLKAFQKSLEALIGYVDTTDESLDFQQVDKLYSSEIITLYNQNPESEQDSKTQSSPLTHNLDPEFIDLETELKKQNALPKSIEVQLISKLKDAHEFCNVWKVCDVVKGIADRMIAELNTTYYSELPKMQREKEQAAVEKKAADAELSAKAAAEPNKTEVEFQRQVAAATAAIAARKGAEAPKIDNIQRLEAQCEEEIKKGNIEEAIKCIESIKSIDSFHFDSRKLNNLRSLQEYATKHGLNARDEICSKEQRAQLAQNVEPWEKLDLNVENHCSLDNQFAFLKRTQKWMKEASSTLGFSLEGIYESGSKNSGFENVSFSSDPDLLDSLRTIKTLYYGSIAKCQNVMDLAKKLEQQLFVKNTIIYSQALYVEVLKVLKFDEWYRKIYKAANKEDIDGAKKLLQEAVADSSAILKFKAYQSSLQMNENTEKVLDWLKPLIREANQKTEEIASHKQTIQTSVDSMKALNIQSEGFRGQPSHYKFIAFERLFKKIEHLIDNSHKDRQYISSDAKEFGIAAIPEDKILENFETHRFKFMPTVGKKLSDTFTYPHLQRICTALLPIAEQLKKEQDAAAAASASAAAPVKK